MIQQSRTIKSVLKKVLLGIAQTTIGRRPTSFGGSIVEGAIRRGEGRSDQGLHHDH